MATTNQITPGMTISLNGKLYRVESSVKVTVPKGTPFIKAMLRDLSTDEVFEKSFKPNQAVQDVALVERHLEFLYPEGKGFLFLDVGNLEQVQVSSQVIGNKVNYLKEGVDVTASFYGESVFAVELPQFLELMVSKIENIKGSSGNGSAAKIAVLETGAKIEVPPFIEVGDIIKVDTKTDDYVQRI